MGLRFLFRWNGSARDGVQALFLYSILYALDQAVKPIQAVLAYLLIVRLSLRGIAHFLLSQRSGDQIIIPPKFAWMEDPF